LYVLDVGDVGEDTPDRSRIRAWSPPVPGIAEVFHAHIEGYAYPPHCHDTWTVLIVDDGAISYDLDMRRCGAVRQTVTILPPWVVHNGGPAPGSVGFRKRNLYLDGGFLSPKLIGPAVDHTKIEDPRLRAQIARLHNSLVEHEESLDAEARLALIAQRIRAHLTDGRDVAHPPERGVASRLRELLDERTVDPVSLAEAAHLLDRTGSHLVRSFTRQFGVSPHAYVIGRRIDAARRLLLRGERPADVATSVGFYDQAHFTRHFKRHTSTTPAAYQSRR
jgi:AraC-like DNA-binding protein